MAIYMCLTDIMYSCYYMIKVSKKSKCLLRSRFLFFCAHYIIIYSFLTRTLTNPRYALSRPASHGCSFVNGARKLYVWLSHTIHNSVIHLICHLITSDDKLICPGIHIICHISVLHKFCVYVYIK